MDYYGWMSLTHRIIPALLLALGTLAQAQTPAPSPATENKRSSLDSALFYQVLLGELYARDDQPAAGFSRILDAAQKSNDPQLYKRAVHIAMDAHAGDSALQATKAWSHAWPDSREANRYLLQVLLGLNRVADTVDALRRDIQLTPKEDQKEVIWSIYRSFERSSDRTLAASTVQRALTPWLNDPVLGPTAWASIGRLRVSAQDNKAALAAARAGLELDATAEHPALLALSLMAPELPGAEALVQKHLPSARPEFHMAYIKALLGAKREVDATTQLQALRTQHPDYADTWLIQGAIALQNDQLDRAEQDLQRYLELTQSADKSVAPEAQRGRTQAFHSLAQIAIQRKDFAQADLWLQRINNPEDVMRAQVRRAGLLAQQGQLEEALKLIENQPMSSMDDLQLKQSATLQLLREHKQYARARTLLQAALAQRPDDLDSVYELAMVQEKLGELDDMELLLRQLMTAKPEDPQAFNALGYSLADRSLRLPEAKALIEKALQLAPKDPFITDSLAWVEYRAGNLELAARLLQTAFSDKPDAEISAHLGEVLWQLKRQPEALKVWREGLQLSPTNESLMDTLNRFQVKL
jgi:tetratricopeptide (TPR) repeat protein